MRRLRSFTQLLLLTLLTLAACNTDVDSAAPIVTDSAGVMLVDYPNRFKAASHRRWMANQEPLFTIGGPSLPMHRVIGPVFQSSGGFVVGNAEFHELLFFDASGQLTGRTGGQGNGPGEFVGLTLLSVGPGDSIVAYERGERRASIFDPDGAFVRSVPMPNLEASVGNVGLVGVSYAGLLGDGRMMLAIHQRTAGTGLVRDSLAVIAFSPGSDRFDALATFPYTWMHWGPHRAPGGSDLIAFPLPVPLSGQTAVGGLGDSLYIATANPFSLSLLTPKRDPAHHARTPTT